MHIKVFIGRAIDHAGLEAHDNLDTKNMSRG